MEMEPTNGRLMKWQSTWDWQNNKVFTFAIAIGIVLPILSAIAFPTYYHKMPSPAWETLRLLEVPFVIFEVVGIVWASRIGLDKRRYWEAFPRSIQLAIVLLFSAMLVGSFFSRAPLASLTMSLMTVVHFLFAISVHHIVVTTRHHSVKAVLPLHAVGLVAITILTAWWFLTPPLPSEAYMGKIEWHAALPGFISVRHFGAWSGAITAAFAVKILFDESVGDFDWDQLFYLLSASVTIWSGTRAAIASIILVVAIFIIAQRKMPSFARIGRAALLTGLALLIAWQLRWPDPSFELFASRNYSNFTAATSSRTVLWEIAIDRWIASPVFGWGTGSFFWESEPHMHTQPHNFLLQFLMSWGTVGGLAACWILGKSVKLVHTTAMSQPETFGLLGLIYSLLLQSTVEGMLHYPRFIVSIVAISAIILARNASFESLRGRAGPTDVAIAT